MIAKGDFRRIGAASVAGLFLASALTVATAQNSNGQGFGDQGFGDQGPGYIAAPREVNLAVRVGALEAEVQSLRGEVEQLSYQLNQALARIDAMNAAMGVDAGAPLTGPASLGGAAPAAGVPGGPAALGAAGVATGATAPVAEAASAAPAVCAAGASANDITPPADPNMAFEEAYGYLLTADYPCALVAFQRFLADHPSHPRAADARFRLGEIYFATRDYASAADAFLAHAQSYPNDARAPESYLKLGSAFARMGREQEACQVFAALRAKFPSADPVLFQRLDLERRQANCS